MNDSQIIQRCKRLCIEGRYDEAIKLTNEISDWDISVKAHLLCMEQMTIELTTRAALILAVGFVIGCTALGFSVGASSIAIAHIELETAKYEAIQQLWGGSP